MEREPEGQTIDLKFIIVSHLRPERVTTLKAIPGCSICVEESQAQAYREHNPGVEIIVHPDWVKGLPAKRQWILERFPNVFMMDDDLKVMRKNDHAAGESDYLSPEVCKEIIIATAHAAKAAGCYLFGFNSSAIPNAYNGLIPIQMTGYIIEGWIGFLEGSKLFYPKDLKLCGDYWISALNAYYHRKVWKDMRFSFVATDTFHNKGGQSEFRNLDSEKAAYDYLVDHFGDQVIQLKKATHLVKLRHPYQKTLVLPF